VVLICQKKKLRNQSSSKVIFHLLISKHFICLHIKSKRNRQCDNTCVARPSIVWKNSRNFKKKLKKSATFKVLVHFDEFLGLSFRDNKKNLKILPEQL